MNRETVEQYVWGCALLLMAGPIVILGLRAIVATIMATFGLDVSWY